MPPLRRARDVSITLARDAGFDWPVIDVDRSLLLGAAKRCVEREIRYGLGSKAPNLNAIPGVDFSRIDCSGYVRWLIWQAAKFPFPDGSVQQHERVREWGLKPSTIDAGARMDNVVRIAFLPPLRAFGGVGHVALIHMAETLESCGGRGPCRRPWGSCAWMNRVDVYVLDFAPG